MKKLLTWILPDVEPENQLPHESAWWLVPFAALVAACVWVLLAAGGTP